MKKLLAIIILASFVACSDTKTESTTNSTSDTTSKMSGGADASGGKMSIQDSTTLLDKQLSDTTGVATDTLR